MSVSSRSHWSEVICRVRALRGEMFGGDVEAVAMALDIPARTWMNYERGVMMPARIMLDFLALTGADPRWILDGEPGLGPSRHRGSGASVN